MGKDNICCCCCCSSSSFDGGGGGGIILYTYRILVTSHVKFILMDHDRTLCPLLVLFIKASRNQIKVS